MHISVIPAFIFSSGISIVRMNLFATYSNAYFGQFGNQSSEQQLINDGNLRHLTRSCSPTGLMHKIMCKFYRMPLMNRFQRGSGESWTFFLAAWGLTRLYISS